MQINYKEFKPSPDLASVVECYWLYTFEGEPTEESPVQKCLPIGMYEVLFHLDATISSVWYDNQWKVLPKSFFTGIYNNPVEWKVTGSARLFGIRLKPESFSRLFAVPAASLFCSFKDLVAFFGPKIAPLPQALYGRECISGIIAQTEIFLSNRLTAMEQQRNYIVEAANLIRTAKGNITIEEVSNTVAVGMRQLQRSFKENIGTTPKGYLRIIRFRNALTSMNDEHEWADITHDLGYSDQAHFIREFREFAGDAPNGVLRNANQYHKKPFQLTGN
jgi:AraC-like DNA-binding protein